MKTKKNECIGCEGIGNVMGFKCQFCQGEGIIKTMTNEYLALIRLIERNQRRK